MFTGWFRSSPSSEWECIADAPTLEEAFRLLIERTRSRGKPGSQRFVTRNGQTPDEFFDDLDRQFRPESAVKPRRTP